MNNQQIYNHLESHNINPSVQRLAIMKYMFEHHKTHPTVEDIYTALLPSIPTLSKATVYNTLKLFVEKKAVISLLIDDRNVRYDINADDVEHAHFRCKNCYCIFDVPIEKSDIPQFKGHSYLFPNEVHISFLGFCINCR